MTAVSRAQEARKALTAGFGLLGEAVATGLLHGTAETVAQAVLAVATVFGVYRVPNGRR